MINISVLNQSTVATDVELAPIVAAIQIQVSRDFEPIWGVDARLTFVPKSQKPDATHWLLVIVDDSPDAGALGFHDLTPVGNPQGLVAAKADKLAGSSLSVTISHEILEMLADPWIMNVVLLQTGHRAGEILALEVCDACEDDALGYDINGVLVSDFCTPKWWMPGMPGPFDFKGHITKPLQILAGGYIGVQKVGTTGWTQVTAEGLPHRAANARHVGSRPERRGIPVHERKLST